MSGTQPQQPGPCGQEATRHSLTVLLSVGLVLALSSASACWHLRTQFTGLQRADLLDQAQIARHLAEGRGMKTSVIRPVDLGAEGELGPRADLHQAPLAPCLLASVFVLTRCSDGAAGATMALLHVALSMLVYVIGARLFGVTAGVLAAAWWAVGWEALRLDFADLRSPLVAMALLAAVSLTLGRSAQPSDAEEEERRPGTMPWFRLGLLAGLCFLTEYSAALLGVALVVWCVLLRGQHRHRRVALVVAGAAVCVVPWCVRGARIAGSPFETRAKLHLVANTTEYPGTSVFRLETTTGVVQFVMHHPRSLFRKMSKTWQRLCEGGIPGLGWLPAAFFIGGAVGGFREKTAAAVGWWSGGLLVLGLLAAGLTACPLAVLPSIVPLVTLLGSHHLVSTIRERVGEDPVVVGGKGALFAIAPQSVRGFALLGLTLAALCPTLSRVAERPWSARRSTRSADMREIRKHVPNPGSVVISDVPWQVAWRTGRTALWLPPATQEEPGERPLSSEVAAIHLSPQVLRYGAGEKVMPWQRMFLGRSRPEGFARPIRLPEGGRLFLREGSAMQPGG